MVRRGRRGRRSGVRFIENNRDRSLTFFKRRAGLYKAAADLSTLTGSRVAIVLESESGKFSSFGTPAADPVVDAFLVGNAPMGPYTSEEQKATITELQNELFQLEKDTVVEEKRKKGDIALAKGLQETSRLAKFVYGKVEDLGVDEIREIYHEISRVRQELKHLLPTMHHSEQQEVGGLRDPLFLQPSWWHSLPSKMPPPRVFPWTPVQPSIQHPRLSVPAPTRLQSSVLNPMMLPAQKLPPRSLAPSMVPLQAQKISVRKEAIPCTYRIWGVDINSNNSSSSFQSPISSSSPPLPLSLHIPQFNESSHYPSPSQHPLPPQQLSFDEAHNNNSIVLPQKYPSSGPTSGPPNKPYYATLDGPNIELGRTDENGGKTYDGRNMFGFSSPLKGDGWIGEMIRESSSVGGQSGDDGAGSNLGDMNLSWN